MTCIVIPDFVPVPWSLEQSLRGDTKRTYTDWEKFIPEGDDVWLTMRPVAPHRDSTAEDLITYGLVLINDARYALTYDGRDYELAPGAAYVMDGRVEHSTRVTYRRGISHGLFAALIWDMPIEWGLAQFQADLLKDERWSGCRVT